MIKYKLVKSKGDYNFTQVELEIHPDVFYSNYYLNPRNNFLYLTSDFGDSPEDCYQTELIKLEEKLAKTKQEIHKLKEAFDSYWLMR